MTRLYSALSKRILVVVLSVLASDALAIYSSISGSVKQMSTGGTTFIYDDFSHSGSATYADGFTYFLNPSGDIPYDFSSTVYSAADGSGVHLTTTMQANRPYGSYPSSTTSISKLALGSALVTFDDFVISGNGNTPITTKLLTHLDGSQSAGANLYTSAKPGEATASTGISIGVSVNGTSVEYGSRSIGQSAGSSPSILETGLLQNFPGSATLVSDSFKATPGVPFSVSLSMSASALADLIDEAGGGMLATTDFSNTFTFPTGVPVFDLPAGYTVNSPSAHIVNNYYINPVPEPSAFAALGLGLAGLVARRRRLRRS